MTAVNAIMLQATVILNEIFY